MSRNVRIVHIANNYCQRAMTRRRINDPIIASFTLFEYASQVLDAGHYELLLRQGLDFFGAARFNAIPERWWRGGTGSSGCPLQPGPGMVNNLLEVANFQTGDGVLQCYRCQGFWHMAANCRHLPRCVRCGEPHSVEFCPRPRNNPICCHCSGPHHAGKERLRIQFLKLQ